MPINEDSLPYLEMFVEETAEQLQALEERLVLLEKNPGDRGCLEDIFRVAHTLKGNSATMGLERMTRLAHAMEDLLFYLRQDSSRVAAEVIDVLLQCLDALRGLADEACGQGECSFNFTDLVGKLEQLASGGTGRSDGMDDARVYRVEVKLDEGCAMRAARAYVVFHRLSELGEVLETRPSLDELQNLGFEGTEITARISTRENPDLVTEALLAGVEVKEARVVLEEENAGEATVIGVGARLDPQELTARLSQQSGRVVLDLSALGELSPAGLNWLLATCASRGLELLPPQHPAGRELLKLLGLVS